MLQRDGAFQGKNSTKFELGKKRINIHYSNCTESARPMDQVKFFAGNKKNILGQIQRNTLQL